MRRDISGAHYKCRLARPSDIANVIRAYKSVYGANAWPGLGPRSSRLFLESHLQHPDNVLVVCEDAADVVVGACLGTARPNNYFRFLWQSELTLLLAYLRDVGIRPRRAQVLAKQFNHDVRAALASLLQLGTRSNQRPANFAAGTAHMAHFFVRPQDRGNGLGAKIITCFEAAMRDRGLLHCNIRTTSDNIASQRAMERAGYRASQTVGNSIAFHKAL